MPAGRLNLEDCAKITVVWVDGPPPGAVQVAHQATLALTADHLHPLAGPQPPRPRHARAEPALASLIDRAVRLEAEGEAKPGGSSPVAQGVVVEAGVLDHHVVVCLDNGTLAVVHRPATVEVHAGTTVVAGAFERVVLDVPCERSIAVIRPGRLLVTTATP